MKRVFTGLTFIVMLILLVVLMPKEKEYTSNYFYMDTYINVKLYTTKSKADQAFKEIDNIYSTYHQLTDRYNEYKNVFNVYTINHSSEPITIDKKLYDIISYGYQMYGTSKGLLNINMGNIIDVWKKYRDASNGIPSVDELDQNIDINSIKLLDNNIIEGNFNIDLGSISKGYTTELVGKHLESINIDKYLINAGGNVKVGKHYNNSKYQIGIKSPNETSTVFKVVKGENISVVTSGGYERNYVYDGVIYHHIIDPNTKYPTNYTKSVTIISKNSGEADALSTILFLMPIEEGKEYIKKYDAEAIWYTNDDEVIMTEGINKYE